MDYSATTPIAEEALEAMLPFFRQEFGNPSSIHRFGLDIEGFACSSGSACKTGSPSPSEVLLALGLSRNLALGSLRVTLGKDTTADHLESFFNSLIEKIEILRG